MLACERWTLTQSSGGAAVLVGLLVGLALLVLVGLALVGLGLALLLAGLALLVGLETMNASREAETVADEEVRGDDEVRGDNEALGDGEVPDDDEDDADGVEEPDWDGEPVAELDADEAEPEPEGDGDTGVLLGVLVGLVADDVGAVGEAEPDELEEGDGEGDVDVGSDVGVGVGVDVTAAGSAWHVVAVLAPAPAEALGLGLGLELLLGLGLGLELELGLVLVLGLGLGLAETALACIVPAHAAPGQPASAPRVRDPPATRLTTAARACARRMKTALFPLLFEVYCVLFVGFVGDYVTVGYEYSYPGAGRVMPLPRTYRPRLDPLAVRRPGQVM